MILIYSTVFDFFHFCRQEAWEVISLQIVCCTSWAYLMKVIPETSRAHFICYLRFYCNIKIVAP